MLLFDKKVRNETRSAFYSESRFEYLNNTARPEFGKLRSMLEEWFVRIPNEHKKELADRFSSKDDRGHFSAFFEIYLHELLLCMGYKVEYHPKLANRAKSPDFLAFKNNKPIFYLEATLASMSDSKEAASKRERILYDCINRMDFPNFFVGVELQGKFKTNPKSKAIAAFLSKSSMEFDPDKVIELYNKTKCFPTFDMKHENTNIRFTLFPKSNSARGKKGIRPIGTQTYGPTWLSTNIKIREAIHDKASRYGKLDFPYIIAVNVLDDFGAEESDISNALFGEQAIVYTMNVNHQPIDQKLTRNPNGAWYGPKGPQKKRISGVFITVNLLPWTIKSAYTCLWHNPWADYPLSKDLWQTAQYLPDHTNSCSVKVEGRRSTEILKLLVD